MSDYRKMTRADFMDFFRDDDKLAELTVDDRIEIFSTILLGSSDVSKELLGSVLSDYSVYGFEVNEIGDVEK